MKKILPLLVAVVLAGGLVFCSIGCTPSVPEIKADDLPEFTGETPSTADEAITILTNAVMGASTNVQTDAGAFGEAVDDALTEGIEERGISIKSVPLQALLAMFADDTSSRTIEADGSEGFTNDDQTIYETDVTLDIVDEKIGDDITVNFSAKVNGQNDMSQYATDGSMTYSGSVDAEGSVEMDELAVAANDSGVESVSGEMGMVVAGEASISQTQDYEAEEWTIDYNYDMTLDVKIGVSISGDSGGKFIFTLYLKENAEDTLDMYELYDAAMEGTTDDIQQVIPEVELLATLTVYDNNNDAVVEETYTEDDLVEDFYADFGSMFID